MLDGEGCISQGVNQSPRYVEQRLDAVLGIAFVGDQGVLGIAYFSDGRAHSVNGEQILLVTSVEADSHIFGLFRALGEARACQILG